MNKTYQDDLYGPVATSGWLDQIENSTQYGNTLFNFSRIKGFFTDNNDSLAGDVSATQCLLY